ncbi:MAG: Asp-tRNA(Asn)/Glu-tRNA(Gln) amidotransferase subunit GatA [Patescibacteria group bacterium]|nr:Asp-tRNA(Asn)/Glu-tRNA(Gln) amidotransferase subunit GatA [Patescibacteria group bacterium]
MNKKATAEALTGLSIVEASKKLQSKEISALELARSYKSAIEERNSAINAYLEVFEDIEAQSKEADLRRARGENHALLGIPLAIKDNILIEGRRASAASKMLEDYTAVYDATVTKKLKAAGAVFLGRTNMDEFALGGSTTNSAFGPTRNPHDETRVAGGTSGGSAAAVAAGMALAALGTDTGGSVRNPASFCGVVGLKPTYGAVSRSGLIAAVSSFDQAGPITKTVTDTELLFNAIRGTDIFDSTTTVETTYSSSKEMRRIGVPRHLIGELGDVGSRFSESLKRLAGEGYDIVDIELKQLTSALAAYYIINFAEVSTNLARFDGVRYGLSRSGSSLVDDYRRSRTEGFGPETRRRIMLGTYVLSAGYYDAFYGRAVASRQELRHEFQNAFEYIDAIATPTMPAPAFSLGEKSDPLSLYLEDIFTVPANLTGVPAISLPMGTVEREGTELPVGIQFMASHGGEHVLFKIGKHLLNEVE